VGAISAVPLSGQISFVTHQLESTPTGPNEIPPLAFAHFVDPGYFDAMLIPVLDGRSIQPGDAADHFRGVVVSRAYAQKWWPGASPIGRRINWGAGDQWQIVGVVENVRHRGLQEDAEEIIYLPTMLGAAEQPQIVRTRDLVVRVSGDPAAFLPIVQREVRELNPRIPLANPRTMDEIVRASAAQTSFTMAVLGSASFVALLLGLVGIYCVVSYVVTRRTREIGVRMALGARARTVVAMVMRQSMRHVVPGIALGALVALFVTPLLQGQLHGVSARDPATFAAMGALLAVVALFASWLPARRAARIDPMTALRNE
jgi:putative ABC transport system permease protein